jgi:hypothetical protein
MIRWKVAPPPYALAEGAQCSTQWIVDRSPRGWLAGLVYHPGLHPSGTVDQVTLALALDAAYARASASDLPPLALKSSAVTSDPKIASKLMGKGTP